MELYERINEILREKRMTKREFARKLISLEPKSSRTKETISENTVYFYLSGKTVINPSLIPYIAEVLDVTEQELFDDSAKAMKKCFRYFLKKADDKEIESFFQSFINSKIQNNINVNFGKVVMKNELLDQKLKKFEELLEYAPLNFLDRVIKKLEEYKKISIDF